MNKCIAVGCLLLIWCCETLADHVPLPVYEVVNAKTDFIQLSLNHGFYKYDWKNDLQDLVVIDAEQNPLPYKVVPRQFQTQVGESTREPLAFFPIAADLSPDSLRKLHRESVQHRAGVTETLTSEKLLGNGTPEFYVIDVSRATQNIDALAIDWSAQTANEYLEVELEASPDLHDWISIARGTLVQINQAGQSLKRNRIQLNLAPKQYDFIRLRVLRGGDDLKITQVFAEHQAETRFVNPERETWSLVGQPARDQTALNQAKNGVAAWEFVRDESTPVDSIRLDFGHYPYADAASIYSRAAANQQWQLRQQGIWFNAQVGTTWQNSEASPIHPNRDKFWRVELKDTSREKANPQLVFAWIPTELHIIGNAKPPFKLAIGQENSNPIYRNQVFDQITSATQPIWASAELVALDTKLPVQDRRETLNWREWLFWGFLLASVIVLGIFAFRLVRQLK